MKITSISVRYGRKYQIADFDWVSLETTLHASIDETEADALDPQAAGQILYTQARAIVSAQARDLLAQQRAIALAVPAGNARTPNDAPLAALAAAELVPDPTEPQVQSAAEPPRAVSTERRTAHTLPRTPQEAEQRFFNRYAQKIGGSTWADVQRFLGTREPKPATVVRWLGIADRVREKQI